MKKLLTYGFIFLFNLSYSTFSTSAEQAHDHDHAPHTQSTPKNIPTTSSIKADAQHPEINWEDLLPPGWDSLQEFSKFKFSQFRDDDPKAEAELKKMRSVFDKAPTEEKMNGKKITLSGFMVPVEEKNGVVTKFLLVAFFGACIHEPPPPANQIIHVTAGEPIRGLKAMAPITVRGTLQTTYITTAVGVAGYHMEKAAIFPHVDKTCFFAPTCESE